MKYLSAQLLALMRERKSQRNLKALFRFFIVLTGLVIGYSVLFHYVMLWEGREHSWITGFYWTLTVMSTLGFGDITFESDLGRAFSIVVLVSGIIFLLILLPYTIIQFFYAPWVEAQRTARTPTSLPEETTGHVILTELGPVTNALIRKIEQFGNEYVIIEPDLEEAGHLHDQDIHVVHGQLNDPESYRKVHAQNAALVCATRDDIVNTSITFTLRQVTKTVPVVATATRVESTNIIQRAGANHVFRLHEMVGKGLARSMVGGDALTHIVGSIDELLIAEANAHRTPLVGKTLRENRLNELGVSVVGVWDRGKFKPATADTVVESNSILLLAGSKDQFEIYDENFAIYNVSVSPVVILGGGRVGQAAAEALQARGVDTCIVDRQKKCVPDSKGGVHGNADDPKVLREAGIESAPAVIITTHNDDLNIYLTIYCRSIRPDIQIITRATLERNTDMLHHAGADFVLADASVGSSFLFNLIQRSQIVTIAEGLEAFRMVVPATLIDKTLIESKVRETTGCTIVGIRNGTDDLLINPPPTQKLLAESEIILIGSVESKDQFLEEFGSK